VSRVALALLLLAAPSPAWAGGHLMISAVGDVRVLVDGEDIGRLATEGTAPVLVDEAGRHGLRVESYNGTLLAEQSVQVDEGETLSVHWDGLRLDIQSVSEASLSYIPKNYSSQSTYRSPSSLQVAQAGTTLARLVAPASPTVGGVSAGLSAGSAGSTLVHTAQSIVDAASRRSSAPSAPSAHEDHSLDSLQQSGFDPYEATGGRPSIDASLASVTFVAAAGTQAMITIDGQPVATLSDGAVEATLPVVPGMHKVMFFDATGAELLHSGHLTVTAGWVLEIRFSTTEPPTSSLPEAWR